MSGNLIRARSAVSAVFFINGMVLASWVPDIPGVKARHAITDGQLGLVLLAMAVGAVLVLPLAGWLDVPADGPVALQEVERRHIVAVLRRTRWRIDGPEGAARLLDLNPSTLRSRMQKLGIRRGDGDGS